MSEKYVVFHVDGGVGKNIMGTAVVKAIKNTLGDEWKIVVVSAYEAVWQNNPYIYRVYNFNNTAYFFDNYIRDKEVIIQAKDNRESESKLLREHSRHEAQHRPGVEGVLPLII